MGIITRLGRTPGLRRLVERHESPEVVREDPDEAERDPRWCAGCGREVLFQATRCRHCGGEALTANELARRSGLLPPPAGSGPTDW